MRKNDKIAAMMEMGKIDIAKIEAAAAGDGTAGVRGRQLNVAATEGLNNISMWRQWPAP